ncbi:MAG: FAD:protein FMN transferase [Planctomycetes bacterium]|nr:FAD:protein FMN transferase [Planctomycetota bacterium]
MKIRIFTLTLILALGLYFLKSTHPLGLLELKGSVFGTLYSVKFVAPAELREKVARRCDELFADYNTKISNWKTESWIRTFNRENAGQWEALPESCAEVFSVCKRLSTASDGAFDITLSPILDLWGFAGEGPKRVPEESEIKALLDIIGNDKWDYRSSPVPAIKKLSTEVELNPNAVAKGRGVDLVCEMLKSEFHLEDFLVDIGGEVRSSGHPPGRPCWIIGIQRPVRESLLPLPDHRVELSSLAMATSGDYQNFFESGGKLYCHIINPRTGRPVGHALASVSILAPTCALADGLATTCLVLGREKSLALLADFPGCEALFMERSAEGNFEVSMTDGFQARLISD